MREPSVNRVFLESNKSDGAMPLNNFVRNSYVKWMEMTDDKPEITTVTAKGQITIPANLRKQYDLEEGDRLIAVPTDYGIVLKKIELPSIEEFKQRVEDRSDDVDLSLTDIEELVHEARGVEQ